MKEYRNVEEKEIRNEYGTACFMILVTEVYLAERMLLAGDVRFSESIVGNYQHT
jgi:hypothetical protein